MKIGVKLVSTISIVNLLGIGLLVGVTLIESQRAIGSLADEEAHGIAMQTGGQIGKWFEEYLGVTRTLAQIMEAYKEVSVEERRNYFNTMLRQVLSSTPLLTSIYANWSPNGLDGRDADYANMPGTDESGRFIPLWTWSDSKISLSYIRGFDWEALKQASYFGTEYILEPSLYTGVQRSVLIANMGEPIRDTDSGEIIGAVGCSLELSTIQTMLEEIKPFGDGHAFLFSPSGIVAAHSDSKRLGKNMRESEQDTFGPFLDTMVDAVSKGTSITLSYRLPNTDTVMQYYAVPFSIGRARQPWTLVVGVSRKTIMAPVYRMGVISLIIGILTIALMSIGAIVIARSISRPIAYTMTILKDIAEGDLTQEIKIDSHDELGDLVRYLNFTIDKIKHLVLSVRKEAQALSLTAIDLASNMTETAASINQITANIKSIEPKTNRQAESVKSTHAVMGQVVEDIDLINTQIQKQSNCVNESSSAVEQMLANIQSVTQTLIKNEANVTKLAQASELGRTGLEKVSGDIQAIAKESAGLLEINAVMETIAKQTSLLSMNAAVEAAHAGESGKGFAVVAGEIRKLAESSTAQSKTISEVLNKIKDSIDKITQATNAVLLNFAAISEGMKTVTDQEASIRNAMEEQGAGSKAIMESIGSLNEITGEVNRSAHRMISGSREVIKESDMLERLTVEIGDGMQEMASGAEQIDEAVHKVNDISTENKKQIGLVMVELHRFKVN
ncbi:MAG: methyl-accepting chemotaxis protein [Spirochaetaceae bacterium]|nr:methyl-accepting chemotaxis protein [Spirochaetaceae bacterium]